MSDDRERCAWARTEASIAYHDREWGRPLHDERALFELLILEGAQAGLSWETILAKRAHYRDAFENFEVERVALFGEREIARLMADPGIVRNRLKIGAAIDNAKAVLALREETGAGLDAYFWRYVDGKPIVNRPETLAELAAATPLSETISRDLRKRGFRFVGPTIVYAFMQASGMVDDHLATCFRASADVIAD